MWITNYDTLKIGPAPMAPRVREVVPCVAASEALPSDPAPGRISSSVGVRAMLRSEA